MVLLTVSVDKFRFCVSCWFLGDFRHLFPTKTKSGPTLSESKVTFGVNRPAAEVLALSILPAFSDLFFSGVRS